MDPGEVKIGWLMALLYPYKIYECDWNSDWCSEKKMSSNLLHCALLRCFELNIIFLWTVFLESRTEEVIMLSLRLDLGSGRLEWFPLGSLVYLFQNI